MPSKYYLDDQGLNTLLTQLSTTLKSHTSGTITRDSNQDVVNPNNFATTGAVSDFLKARKKLIINESNFSNVVNTQEYNGEGQVEINLNIADENDIRELFGLDPVNSQQSNDPSIGA